MEADSNGLKNEIASTQRLVVKSARSVRRFARELDSHHEAQSDQFVPTLGKVWCRTPRWCGHWQNNHEDEIQT
jgi:hypothetical protein